MTERHVYVEGEHLEIDERWMVVDRWWTDDPVRKCWATVCAPDGEKIAIGYDVGTKTWSLAHGGTE